MADSPHSLSNSTETCLRVLQRLLEDEVVMSSQLSYVIENIHNPLLRACQFRAPHTPVVEAALKEAEPLAALRERVRPTSAAHIQPPQPALRPPKKKNTAPKRSQRSKATSSALSHGNSRSSSTNHSVVMNFSQYWTLFANLCSLYSAHGALLIRLESVVERLSQLQQQHTDDVGEADEESQRRSLPPLAVSGEQSAVQHAHSGVPTPQHKVMPLPRFRSLEQPVDPPSCSASSSDHRQLSAAGAARLVDSTTNAPPRSTSTRDGGFTELSQLVLGYFTSDVMQRYVAEHIMYTCNYSRAAAPKVLEIARLWRWSFRVDAARGNSSAPFSALQPDDAATLRSYLLVLDFLLRSLGSGGVPDDTRVSRTSLPEAQITVTAEHTADIRGVRAPTSPRRGGSGKPNGSRTGSSATSLPAIPADWRGFETLVVLLATPLPDLRRQTHVARCLLEARVLPQADCRRLQSQFIATAAQHLSDEGSLALDTLAEHDVQRIVDLIDDYRSTDGPRLPSPRHAQDNARKPPPSPPLHSEDGTRVLVHYGRLLKRFRRGKHERLMFLFSDWLCYVEELSNGRFRLCGSIALRTARVLDMADCPAADVVNQFEVCAAKTKHYVFIAETPEQKRQWIEAIRYTIRHYRRVHNTARVVGANVKKSHQPGDVQRQMRPTAPPLQRHSRLAQQRRYDAQVQASLDRQRAVAAARSSPATAMCGARPAASASEPTSPEAVAPPRHAAPGAGEDGAPGNSRSPSFAQARVSVHQPVDYDVVPWPHPDAGECRLRTSDANLQSANVALPGEGSRSRAASLTGVCDGLPSAAASAPPLAGHHSYAAPSSHLLSVLRPRGPPELLLPTLRSEPPTVIPPVHAVSHTGSQPNCAADMLSSSSSRAAQVYGTPLRRPVSERFESVQASTTLTSADKRGMGTSRGNSYVRRGPSTTMLLPSTLAGNHGSVPSFDGAGQTEARRTQTASRYATSSSSSTSSSASSRGSGKPVDPRDDNAHEGDSSRASVTVQEAVDGKGKVKADAAASREASAHSDASSTDSGLSGDTSTVLAVTAFQQRERRSRRENPFSDISEHTEDYRARAARRQGRQAKGATSGAPASHIDPTAALPNEEDTGSSDEQRGVEDSASPTEAEKDQSRRD